MGQGVLEGVRIVDLCEFVAGPHATNTLAAMGAEVIKVESKKFMAMRLLWGGDVNESPGFNCANQGKLSVRLNLKKAEAIDLVKSIIKKSDVVYQNFRPGKIDDMGLGYEELKKVKPDIIMVSSTMLGQTGPDNAFRGFGQHGAALAGWGTTLAYAEGEAVAPFSAYTDYIGVRYVAIAIIEMFGVEARRRQLAGPEQFP